MSCPKCFTCLTETSSSLGTPQERANSTIQDPFECLLNSCAALVRESRNHSSIPDDWIEEAQQHLDDCVDQESDLVSHIVTLEEEGLKNQSTRESLQEQIREAEEQIKAFGGESPSKIYKDSAFDAGTKRPARTRRPSAKLL